VGAGIVAGSDSDDELQETGWKLKVLLSALGAT
jgi:isochorismate synthase EntC